MGNIDLRGATLLVGAAGTGKTTRLVRRTIDLLEAGEGGTLFLVHNRRAARALQERILWEFGRSTGDVRVATWHSFALSVLRLYHDTLAFDREPGLLTGPEQFALVKEMLAGDAERAHWSAFPRHVHLAGFVEELREFVLRAQDAMESPDQLEERARLARRPDLEGAARFFRRYLDQLNDRDMVDAPNAIALTISLIEEHPEIADDVKAGTRHLLVDDYQNVTPGQERLLRALFVDGGSVAVAADPDATVFGFRGGLEDAIARYRAAFAPVREEASAKVHRGRPDQTAWLFDHLTEEADAIAREARRLRTREGIGWGEIAVIVRRYGAVSRSIQRAFERAGVPYVVVGENRPLGLEPAVRPMLDVARAALRTADREDLLPGLLSGRVVGLDPYDVRALRREARLRETSLAGLLTAPPPELPERHRVALDGLRKLLEDLADRAMGEDRPDGVFWWLWERLDHFRDMVRRGDPEELDAVTAFARAIERFSDRRPGARFEDFLDVLEGVEFGPEPWNMPEERRPDAVRLMTAHHAVGAEFDAAFVAGCVEGEFPDPQDVHAMLDLRDLLHQATPFERQQARLAEERRLFGIAATRARRRLAITAARETSQHQALQPSPFIHQLGLAWSSPERRLDALTRREAEAAARRVLRAASATEAEREEALDLLARLPGVDPSEWWFEKGWTNPGIPVAEEELRTSYSRLSTFENCGLQYLYQVELGLDPATSHQMLVGTWVHHLVDRCARGEIEPSLEALTAALDEVWDPTIFEGRSIERRRYRDCVEMLEVWLTCDGDLDTLASEVGFEFPIDGAILRGRIDRLVRCGRSMVRVIDYKTSRWAKSQEDIDEDLQLAIYNLAMHRDEGLAKYGVPKHLELAWLGTAWKGGFKRRGTDPTRREGYLEQTEETVTSFVTAIKEERFAPSGGADCQWCSFKPLCPVWPEGDEVVL